MITLQSNNEILSTFIGLFLESVTAIFVHNFLKSCGKMPGCVYGQKQTT